MRRLPDPDTLFRLQVKLSVTDLERLVPGIEVAHDQRADVAGRVAVDREQLLKQLIAILGAPDLAEAQEEALTAGRLRQWLTSLSSFQGLPAFR